jgi:6-phosphogluconolactonase (cycloisomerase 2 family)
MNIRRWSALLSIPTVILLWSCGGGTVPVSGTPTSAPAPTATATQAPADDDRTFLYIDKGDTITGYHVDPSTGALAAVGTAPATWSPSGTWRMYVDVDVAAGGFVWQLGNAPPHNLPGMRVFQLQPDGAPWFIEGVDLETREKNPMWAAGAAASDRYVYASYSSGWDWDEVDSSGIVAYAITAGGLEERNRFGVRAVKNPGEGVAAVALDPRGSLLYAVEDAPPRLVAYAVAEAEGTEVRALPLSEGLVSLVSDPAGRYLYGLGIGPHGKTDRLFVFDTDGGRIKLADEVALGTDREYQLVVDPNGRYLFLAVQGAPDPAIDTYSIDRTTGRLAARSTTPMPFPHYSIAISPAGRLLYMAGYQVTSAYAIDGSGTLTSLGPVGPEGRVLAIVRVPQP